MCILSHLSSFIVQCDEKITKYYSFLALTAKFTKLEKKISDFY